VHGACPSFFGLAKTGVYPKPMPKIARALHFLSTGFATIEMEERIEVGPSGRIQRSGRIRFSF
jgi:hypothetical protein